MQQKHHFAKWLLLPFALAACVTGETNPADPAPSAAPKGAVSTNSALPKTVVTPALAAEVIAAKEARDNAGLPEDYQAEYVITTTAGTTTAKLTAPEGSGNDNAQSNNYYFNSAEIFPAGESTGTVKTSLLAEDGKTRVPHTEETFMSYQQFYSGISGSQKQAVYFGEERVERDEPFFFELPDGLLTPKEQLPTSGTATYLGKAIDGARFGELKYQVDFASKEGHGAIIWDKSKAGNLGDITLQAGKIQDQVLSVYREPDLFPDEYAHRAPGLSGVAEIAGQSDKKYQYKAVFFGPKAEELGGLVYEQNEQAKGHGLSDEIEQNNVASFVGTR